VALREVHTDQHGNLAFGDLPAGTYPLVAYGGQNQRLADVGDIVVAADQDPKPIEVQVPR